MVIGVSTLASGPMAERGRLTVYLGYVAVLSGLVVPIAMHWVRTPKPPAQNHPGLSG